MTNRRILKYKKTSDTESPVPDSNDKLTDFLFDIVEGEPDLKSARDDGSLNDEDVHENHADPSKSAYTRAEDYTPIKKHMFLPGYVLLVVFVIADISIAVGIGMGMRLLVGFGFVCLIVAIVGGIASFYTKHHDIEDEDIRDTAVRYATDLRDTLDGYDLTDDATEEDIEEAAKRYLDIASFS